MAFEKISLKKGKRGTELGPNNIKQDFLFNNLENLGKLNNASLHYINFYFI